jgi:hypothetical protein
MRKTAHAAFAVALLGLLIAPLAGCEKPGPAERAGTSVDKAGQNLRDTVDPPTGPGEKVGRSIDRATQ